MKGEYIKIFTLLIALFYVNILEINNIRRANKRRNNIINDDEDYIRFLDDDFTKDRTDQDDKDSIKTCQNSDELYFKHLVTGESFSFNKYVDERDAVNNKYI
jgi:hypothetical protein